MILHLHVQLLRQLLCHAAVGIHMIAQHVCGSVGND